MKEEEERIGMVRLLHEIVYKGPTDERGTWTGWCVGFLWVDLCVLAFVSWPLCLVTFVSCYLCALVPLSFVNLCLLTNCLF